MNKIVRIDETIENRTMRVDGTISLLPTHFSSYEEKIVES
jgi:hypothetical protein